MRVIDVDSHFMEPVDWLEQIDPTLAKLIPPSDESFIERVVQGVVGDLIEAIPRKQRPENLIELLAPSGRRSLEALLAASAEQQKEMMTTPPAGYDGDARIAFCDAHGIDIQLVNSTMGSTPYVLAMKQGRRDLALRAFQAFNSWAAGTFHGHTDRLIPVAAGARQHSQDALVGRRHHRQAVGPAPLKAGLDGVVPLAELDAAALQLRIAELGQQALPHPRLTRFRSAAGPVSRQIAT